jgi:hypothetical protein
MNKLKSYWEQYKNKKKEKTTQEVFTEIKDGFQIREKWNKLWIVENNIGIIELDKSLSAEEVIEKLTEARNAAINYYNGKVN